MVGFELIGSGMALKMLGALAGFFVLSGCQVTGYDIFVGLTCDKFALKCLSIGNFDRLKPWCSPVVYYEIGNQ